MPNAIDFLRTIRDQADAGDPAVVGTVQLLATYLDEELGDVRAGWVAGLSVEHGGGTYDVPFFPGWIVNPDPQVVSDVYTDAIRELSRRVLAAMTRECPRCRGYGAIERLDSGHMRRFGLREWNGCQACGGSREVKGIGFTLTEAVACWCAGGTFDPPTYRCPDCAGKGWCIKGACGAALH